LVPGTLLLAPDQAPPHEAVSQQVGDEKAERETVVLHKVSVHEQIFTSPAFCSTDQSQSVLLACYDSTCAGIYWLVAEAEKQLARRFAGT
jgi:hypothetical protein